mmetsp:Transcript_21961/g.70732  ORF Transcript_21961/g.70732 Transcript_21961/m.70732 type:complete len:205 (-) Transcript_21961:890-1504(-)
MVLRLLGGRGRRGGVALLEEVARPAAFPALVALGGVELLGEVTDLEEIFAALAPLKKGRRRRVEPDGLVAVAADVLVLSGDHDDAPRRGGVETTRGVVIPGGVVEVVGRAAGVAAAHDAVDSRAALRAGEIHESLVGRRLAGIQLRGRGRHGHRRRHLPFVGHGRREAQAQARSSKGVVVVVKGPMIPRMMMVMMRRRRRRRRG